MQLLVYLPLDQQAGVEDRHFQSQAGTGATGGSPQAVAVAGAQLRAELKQAMAGRAAQGWQLLQPIYKNEHQCLGDNQQC
jgi:hypothetical protein